MPYIPPAVRNDAVTEMLSRSLRRIGQGKVRDTFWPEQRDCGPLNAHYLVVASNRISIFDFVLGQEVPDKGAALTEINVFWHKHFADICPTDLIAFGSDIDEHLRPWPSLHNNSELQSRGVIVNRLRMVPVECVVRKYLSGSAWAEYAARGKEPGETINLWGHELPRGLHDGGKLASPIFTPTTKSYTDHDEPINVHEFRKLHGHELESLSIALFNKASRYLETCGLVLADTKFEFGYNPSGEVVLADEAITPDSSRLWLIDDWRSAQAMDQPKSPPGFDKQLVRDWGLAIKTVFHKGNASTITGIKNLDCRNKRHQIFAGRVPIPANVIHETRERYLLAVRLITEKSPEEFRRTEMGIFTT